MAAEFYGDSAGPTGKKLNSVFNFVKLDGPLLKLEFAESSGFTGGFGEKSDVKMPAVDRIVEFSFVTSKTVPGSSALAALKNLTTPMENTYWAAVGLKVSAFQMIALDAVAIVQFGTSVRLNIVTVATGAISIAESVGKDGTY